MNRLAYSGLLLAVAMIGCGGAEDDGQIDQALLAQYRAALPQENQVMAKSPEPSMASKLGEPAIYPVGSKDIVVGINGAVGGIVEIMRAIVEQEPSIYSSETKEFFWGPYPNNDGFGFVAAYIREAPAGSDFKYHYALLRGADKDIAKLSPVIWGGATPDPNNKDYGVGVTLWDFEANRAFEEANNPDVANVKLDQGRFVAVYARAPTMQAKPRSSWPRSANSSPRTSPRTPPPTSITSTAASPGTTIRSILSTIKVYSISTTTR